MNLPSEVAAFAVDAGGTGSAHFLQAISVAAVFFGARSLRYHQQLQALDTALANTPGIHVSELSRDGGSFVMRGLRDPLAATVADVAKSVEIPADRIDISTQPFQSLQPDIVAARAAQMFGPPDGVRFSVTGTTLFAQGDAPWAWQRQLRSRFSSLAGIQTLNLDGLAATDRQQFAERVESIAPRKFFFARGVEFVEGSAEALRRYAEELAALRVDATRFDYALPVTATGSADRFGDAAVNAELSERRANAAIAALADAGVAATIVRQPEGAFDGGEQQEDASQRFVEVTVTLKVTPALP